MPKIILRKIKALELQEKISKLLSCEVKEKWNSSAYYLYPLLDWHLTQFLHT